MKVEEKVARALCAAAYTGENVKYAEKGWKGYIPDAKAAIKVFKEVKKDESRNNN